ncbi:hypothetical protein E3N88_15676 [Mikania micrantha]|uniref:Uncharacterized protein n=1 Tax=Mikania micrantha TaxID=192012 RepID=A0A5N6NYV0_9ASTR|nr:hypothetical protein E3N88_15676 [Mikania micrantha]
MSSSSPTSGPSSVASTNKQVLEWEFGLLDVDDLTPLIPLPFKQISVGVGGRLPRPAMPHTRSQLTRGSRNEKRVPDSAVPYLVTRLGQMTETRRHLDSLRDEVDSKGDWRG